MTINITLNPGAHPMYPPRAQGDSQIGTRIETLETEVKALKARLDKLETPEDPATPEARLPPVWTAALAKVQARHRGPGVIDQ